MDWSLKGLFYRDSAIEITFSQYLDSNLFKLWPLISVTGVQKRYKIHNKLLLR